MKFKTFMLRKEDVKRDWYVVDAKDKVLGRLATRIARILNGKHKAIYTPHVDCGDGIVVINASKIRLTGKKIQQKYYTHYTGFPSGLRINTFQQLLDKKPEKILRLAVKGMLPKNKLGTRMLKRLKVYGGEEHQNNSLNLKGIEL